MKLWEERITQWGGRGANSHTGGASSLEREEEKNGKVGGRGGSRGNVCVCVCVSV